MGNPVGANALIERTKITYPQNTLINTPLSIQANVGDRPTELASEDFHRFLPTGNSLYAILVKNESAITAITVQVFTRDNDADAVETSYPITGAITVAANSNSQINVEGMDIGLGWKITVINTTALGAGQGFDCHLTVRGA